MDASEALASFQRFSRQDMGCHHRRTIDWNRVLRLARFIGKFEIPSKMPRIPPLVGVMAHSLVPLKQQGRERCGGILAMPLASPRLLSPGRYYLDPTAVILAIFQQDHSELYVVQTEQMVITFCGLPTCFYSQSDSPVRVFWLMNGQWSWMRCGWIDVQCRRYQNQRLM